MDLTLALSAIVFTLLALVVATSLLSGSTPAGDLVTARGSEEAAAATLNGHGPEARRGEKKKKKAVEDWAEMSCSSHDHWDVVKNVQSEEAQSHPEEAAPPAAASSSSSCTSSLSVPATDSRDTSVDARCPPEAPETPEAPEAPLGRGRRSFIGLSDTQLLKCAFSGGPQTEGAAESPGANEQVESSSPLKYVPGKARSHHLEMMMSREELEDEQRVQREQLAAIFQLLKENTETFGEVSEGDLEEQMRLYSI